MTREACVFYAHSTDQADKSDWQLLRDHLVSVATLSAQRGAKFGAGGAATLAGLLHDLGKYTAAFQRRLEGGASVDHATAGAYEVGQFAGVDPGMAELISYAIAGHHGGLPDKLGGGSLKERLDRPRPELSALWQTEIGLQTKNLLPAFRWRRDRAGFQLGLLGRMIFSCLVDADFRDTEAFYASVNGQAVDRSWPALPDIIAGLVARLDTHLAELGARSPASDVNRLRAEVLAHVRSLAARQPGVFTLTVPTGGGKTLASLAFALEHARRHGLDRVVYAIPFTSVIDQTAQIFRTVLGEDVVLEHHSAIEEPSAADEDSFRAKERANKLRLAMEDWAAPVVVTTNVQLFESLFAHRPSRCRKLHNLARSVVVLDEAQTIPLPLLRPCVAALDELARNYGTSIVLCTATQPALRVVDGFKGGFDIGPAEELAPEPDRLATALKRVNICRAGEMTDGDVVAALGAAPQALVIVNSRAHALALYRTATQAGLDGLVHLTARQYAEHRRRILAEVRERLRHGETCRLIATSLVEAGVDLDFPRVWRAEAGLEQILQAAGRCNREGRRAIEASVVTVFRPAEAKSPRELAQLAADFARIAPQHDDLHALSAIHAYFSEVYWRKGEERLDMIRIRGSDGETRQASVIGAFTVDITGTDFAYRTVGENFRLIESGLAPVIVARDEAAREVLAELAGPDSHAGRVARKLQRFVVQVPPRARTVLTTNGHVQFVEPNRFGDQFAVLMSNSLYSDDAGLLWERSDYLDLESSII
jgi:CRISPR-associated endonuclease/helicase Cas3